MIKIEYIPIGLVSPSKRNPRMIDEEKFSELKRSIRDNPEYFEARPILVNRGTGRIFAGNMRWRAAVDLGLEEVPVAYMDVDEDKERELMIRDNVNQGRWDVDILANEFDTLELFNWGLDIEGMLPTPAIKRMNFMIVCESMEERERVKEVLGIVTKKISYQEFIEKWESR